MLARLSIFTIITLILVNIQTFAQDKKHRLLGNFIRLSPNDSRNISGYEYYFYLSTDKGQQMAYPVTFKNKTLLNKIKPHMKKSFFVEGEVSIVKIPKGELGQTAQTLSIEKANFIELKDINASKNYDPKGIRVGKSIRVLDPNQSDKIVIKNVNNTVTNMTIFTAGAALLASILLGK